MLRAPVEEREYACEWCNSNQALQAHHCLYHRAKRFKKELDCKENIEIACKVCHTDKRLLDSRAHRQWFWERQCKRYGEEYMIEWRESLPMMDKSEFVPGCVEAARKGER